MQRMGTMYIKHRNAQFPCVRPSAEVPSDLDLKLLELYTTVCVKRIDLGFIVLVFELLQIRERGSLGSDTTGRAAVLIGTELPY